MAFISSAITSYKVVAYGTSAESAIGAFIHCYHQDENVVSCVFYNDEDNVPPNNQPPNRVNLTYPMSKFASILSILQNEEPLFFGFFDTNQLGYVSTNSEPVGEEES